MEGAEGNVYVLRKTYQNETAAKRAAAKMDTAPERRGTVFDNHGARPRRFIYGMHLTVSGFKPEIDTQDWIIARAEHVIGDNGFTTKMELEAKISDWIAETE